MLASSDEARSDRGQAADGLYIEFSVGRNEHPQAWS